MNYNLLDEEWIPVLYRNGEWKRVGIRKALEEAASIREIAATNPMDRVALLRFLVAILYWCKGSPPGGVTDSLREPFPPEWFAKLEEERGCFNLFGEGKRFYQDSQAQRERASTDLLQEIPAGNNFWHFRHSIDGTNGLCPACCAMGLLRLPLFSVSGLPDLKAGINGTPPIYVIPCGATLFETLVANWVPCVVIGIPAWVDPIYSLPTGRNVPLLVGLTMLSRRVFLHMPVNWPARCVGCGEQTRLVVDCEFQTAGEQKNDDWNDPHVIYSGEAGRKAAKAPDLRLAGKFKMDRPWPELLARIVESKQISTFGRVKSLLVVGFSTSKALNIDVWERRIDLLSDGPVHEKVNVLLQQWQREAAILSRKARSREDNERKRRRVDIAALIDSIRPHVEGGVSDQVGDLIAKGEEAWEEAAQCYRPLMQSIARSLSPGVTVEAVQRRRQIGSVMPDMRPKAENAKKPRRRKGGAS